MTGDIKKYNNVRYVEGQFVVETAQKADVPLASLKSGTVVMYIPPGSSDFRYERRGEIGHIVGFGEWVDELVVDVKFGRSGMEAGDGEQRLIHPTLLLIC